MAMSRRVMGSPPRGRGKEVADEGIGGIIRITPAWTGKSRPAAFRRWPEWDHPRMGGEKQTQPTETGRPLGSPPHGRGKAPARCPLMCCTRITPAWAGKSGCRRFSESWKRDHPRVGGEKILEPSMGVGNFGSPPHGRGKVVRSGVHRCCRGITPAWAGKRCSSGRCCMRQRDHPRVGGEKM